VKQTVWALGTKSGVGCVMSCCQIWIQKAWSWTVICNMLVEYHVIMYIKYIWYISKKSWHHKGCFLPLNSPFFSLAVTSHCHGLISHLTQFCVFCMYCGTCSRPEYSWYICFWMLRNRQSMNYVTRLSL
jgi:hypothetical protein